MRPDSPMRLAMSMLHNCTGGGGGGLLTYERFPDNFRSRGPPLAGERNTYQETAALSAGWERQSRSFTVESLNRKHFLSLCLSNNSSRYRYSELRRRWVRKLRLLSARSADHELQRKKSNFVPVETRLEKHPNLTRYLITIIYH